MHCGSFAILINIALFAVITTTASIDDCSWANVGNNYISPLGNTCIRLKDASTKVYCDNKLNIFQDMWDSFDCSGTTTSRQLNLSPSDYNCESSCKSIMTTISSHESISNLLPPAPENPSPTNMPTRSPITQVPTQYITAINNNLSVPITQAPTQSVTTNTSMDNDSMEINTNQREFIFSMPSIPIHVICLLIVVSLFMASIYYLTIKKQNKKKKRMVSTIKIFILLTFTSNIIGISCLSSISIIMATNEWTVETYNKSIIPYYLLSIAYSFGKLCLELFYLFRVYKAFRNSIFSLSKIVLIILIFCLTAVSFMWCFLFIISTQTNINVPNYFYLLVSVAEMFLVFILLYLFTNRLSSLLLRHKFRSESKCKPPQSSIQPSVSVNNDIQRCDSVHKPKLEPYPSTASTTTQSSMTFETNSSSISSVPTIKSVELSLSDKQIKWIFLITRCILLSSISLITTIIFGIFAFYYSQFGIHIFIVYALWSIDMATNSVCLYLNFIFADKMYNKSCVYCHGICQKMVQKITARKMLKKHLNDIANLETV